MDSTPLEEALLACAIHRRLPAILAEVARLLRTEHPDYADFLDSEFQEVAKAARVFANGLFERALAGTPSGPAGFTMRQDLCGPEQTLFEEIGRAHRQLGQDLAGLLAAYRVGAAVAWRHIVEEAMLIAVPAESLAALAAGLFASIDQLSTASVRGYVRQEVDSVQSRDRARERLVELLLSGRCDSAALAAAATDAGWPPPRRAGVLLYRSGDLGLARMPSMGRDYLWSRRSELTVAVIPDPHGPGQRAGLETTLRGLGAVVGESVSTAQLPASLRRAQLALTLRERGVLTDDPLFVDQHLDTLIVHNDPTLLDSLRQAVLAPLARLPAPTRERLEQTLMCWLNHMGNRQAVADELHVHPQTVRYRLGQLRGLFAAGLNDPRARAAMMLALAWGRPFPSPSASGEHGIAS